MTKTPDNFTNKLKKLENYYLLSEEKDHFIIGREITITEHIQQHNVFSFYERNIDKQIWVFFILGLNEQFERFKEYRRMKIPMLILATSIVNSSIDSIEDALDQYIQFKFKG